METLRLGLDIGSTTVKAVVLGADGELLFSRYQRHHAELSRAAAKLLTEVCAAFPDAQFRAAVCGSGGRPIAARIGANYVQEVVANAAAVRHLYPRARTAIELGGQDAKLLFFWFDPEQGRLVTSDMRMNGSCAGGTGAFIDEVASLLRTPTEEFDALAAKGTEVLSISGRCGVFAKTDIQSLLNAGARREDIALSAFHAIVHQTVGGLAQGLELKPPVIFEGGPLTFDATLRRAFAEELNLTEDDMILPEKPETIVARGAALAMDELFTAEDGKIDLPAAATALTAMADERQEMETGAPYFASDAEREQWLKAHALPAVARPDMTPGETLEVYIGIDAGSTTSKMVFLDRAGQVIDRFYANNRGDPLAVVRQGLMVLRDYWQKRGVALKCLGLGVTGYGEEMIARAFGADYHTVETVAHAAASTAYEPDATFILDIGGQDMKAIWLDHGVVTNIVLNEACSSGCGSFLENFASSLGIPVEEIADAAFRAEAPAALGSRCTVFMNSTIITAQKNGCKSDDIMAGLCRSIIENVFTKVVRISGPEALGDRVVVQGGTFRNDAVLRAMEQYLGKPVTRAPYPGEMGAIGAALLTSQKAEAGAFSESSFIGFEALDDFWYARREGLVCEGCANHCMRTVVSFSSGASYITGNRCPRGGDEEAAGRGSAPDLFLRREQMLFQNYPYTPVRPEQGITVGLPRTLEFWDSMPFWSTFFKALGYTVKFSHPSSRAQYEKGIPFVPSDTVCFPAKLAHGHIRDLVEQRVDRIFMPMIMEMPRESADRRSDYVCAVVKGYPLMIRNSEDPEKRWEIPFETPMFHWHRDEDRLRQLVPYMREHWGVSEEETVAAFREGERAILRFKEALRGAAARIIEKTRAEGGFAVVLAGRPYHTDPLVSHDLSRAFSQQGVAVLTVDSLPDLAEQELQNTRAEITNNFHVRMLAGAMRCAKDPNLEYVQIVSFGCGHDAILSDEITRIMQEVGHKTALILKLDEGAAVNSIHIRVRSFLETVAQRHAGGIRPLPPAPLADAYPAKFEKSDRNLRTILVPNVSVAFCRIMSAVLVKYGLKAEPLPAGGIRELQLAKKYVHNDTCFPAQMCIGEFLTALRSGRYKIEQTAVVMAKYIGDCRLSHYSALLRRALDAAGFEKVPIVSTDPDDVKDMHPGVRLRMRFNLISLWGISMMDYLEELRRKIRPYEFITGEADRVFNESIDAICQGLQKNAGAAIAAFRRSIDAFCRIRYDRSKPRPRVFVTGEYLATYHPGSNFRIEEYLERNGMEVILPRMVNVFHKDYYSRLTEMRKYKVRFPVGEAMNTVGGEGLFALVQKVLEPIAAKHPLYEPDMPFHAMAKENDSVMEHTFASGEGWLIPGEIREYARRGVKSFVILQPFGCLPNHICGRGVMKRIKEEFPAIQILPLDLEPDTSFANVENRLQMLILNEKTRMALA